MSQDKDTLELPPSHPNLQVEDRECYDLTSGRQLSPSAYDGDLHAHNRNPSQASITSQDSCHDLEVIPERQGLMQVIIQPSSTLKRTHSIGRHQMAQYRMATRPRGLALIIANERYHNDILDERIGSECDRKNLQNLFEQMDFEVEVKSDLTKPELVKALKAFSEDRRHEDNDMMILVILSHGREGEINTVEGQPYELERVFAQFNNQQCPYLKGKPKFFIVQACRGNDRDFGTTEAVDRVQPNRHHSEGSPVVRRVNRRMAGRDMAGPFEGAGDTETADNLGTVLPPRDDLNWQRPTWEDMVIAYSTLPGFTSNRDHELGTWFIQSLVEVFANHSAEYELVDLLRMTAERLSQFENQDREKQTCTIEMRGLYKRLYFNPEPTSYKRRKMGTLSRGSNLDQSAVSETSNNNGASGSFQTIEQIRRLSIEQD